ncbi:uncharacterized protein VTP21DRAFT_3005 [Calcarisporiella thermophila]|uniref:uncharacterized protein n=1 Tax=Calcarisporiella thermophila TaxID=911321 RepID=UPI0037449B11
MSVEKTIVEATSFFLAPFFGAAATILEPIANILTSPRTQRVAVKSFFITLGVSFLMGVAVLAYGAFWYMWIPRVENVVPIYLQYGRDTNPSAIIDFAAIGLPSPFLTADLAYDVSVELHVPVSERNVEIGNFMVNLELQGENGKVVHSSSRPTILKYDSPVLRLMKTFWRALPLLLDFADESQHLQVPLLENVVESYRDRVTRARISISDSRLMVYSARLRLDARFRGLRYFMYYWPITTAVVFVCIFLFWELVFGVIAWRSLVTWWRNRHEGTSSTTGSLSGAGGAGYSPSNAKAWRDRDRLSRQASRPETSASPLPLVESPITPKREAELPYPEVEEGGEEDTERGDYEVPELSFDDRVLEHEENGERDEGRETEDTAAATYGGDSEASSAVVTPTQPAWRRGRSSDYSSTE